MTKRYRIAIIAGDGIGKVTMPDDVRVLTAASQRFGFILALSIVEWHCDFYYAHGEMMAADELERLKQHDAFILAAGGQNLRIVLRKLRPSWPCLLQLLLRDLRIAVLGDAAV